MYLIPDSPTLSAGHPNPLRQNPPDIRLIGSTPPSTNRMQHDLRRFENQPNDLASSVTEPLLFPDSDRTDQQTAYSLPDLAKSDSNPPQLNHFVHLPDRRRSEVLRQVNPDFAILRPGTLNVHTMPSAPFKRIGRAAQHARQSRGSSSRSTNDTDGAGSSQSGEGFNGGGRQRQPKKLQKRPYSGAE